MKVKLINHTFPDDPTWFIMKPNIPLGTEYEVIGYERRMIITELTTGKTRSVETFLCEGNGNIGYIPTICLEVINENTTQTKGN